MNQKELDVLKWAIAEIREKMEQGFFGDVKFQFKGGSIVHSETREHKKPPQLNRC